MNVADFVTDAMNTVRGSVVLTLEGLAPEHLNQRPADESNPIGWLIWHNSSSSNIIFSTTQLFSYWRY